MLKQISILLLICFSSLWVVAQTQQATQPIKILLSPKPSYTQESLKKRIGGIILLKVTFQASGEVGETLDVTQINKGKLVKSGLTAAAIEAAKQIKFEPAIENGKPINVTKTIEYTFLVSPKKPKFD